MLIAMQHWKVMLADLSILIFFSTETQAIPLPTKCTASHKLKSHFDEAFFCFAVGKTEWQNCLGWKNPPNSSSPHCQVPPPHLKGRQGWGLQQCPGQPVEPGQSFPWRNFPKMQPGPPLAQPEVVFPCPVLLLCLWDFLDTPPVSSSAAKPYKGNCGLWSLHPPRFNDLCTSKPD